MQEAHKLLFHGKFERNTRVEEIIQSDVMGIEMSYPDRFQYVCTFLDDHSRYTSILFLRHRDEVSEACEMVLHKLVESQIEIANFQFEKDIITIHSDGAKEYKSLSRNIGAKHLDQNFSCPYTPEHNAVAERVNRTIVEAGRALLIQAELPNTNLSLAISFSFGTELSIQLLGRPLLSCVLEDDPT